MNNIGKLSFIAVAFASVLSLSACDVDVEDKGKLPEVDVEEGRMPEVDVTAPDVDAHMEEKTIKVPDVDVDYPEEDDQ